ncbi:hypothetical protein [Alicyclobacillus sp. ALC3]|uniref:hypothetical protein n=1 Tax=Alicyclobacillus sp. ALC3 TaxID=2796143 RepID=UPI002378D3FF|nr:hypothetical protein [Alicyclobacillus sp. ALC3]WDL95325.1 hypothetical protein JC200_12960 [Alicyclobacillus sp. ALC3]
MNLRALRSRLKALEKTELLETIVQIYKVLPKELIEEELIDDIIADRSGYLELRQREKEEEKRYRQAYQAENVTHLAALQKWKTIPEHARELLLNNVWCSRCGETRLKDYTVEHAGPNIVLRGRCTACHHDVARHVEIE